MRYKVKVKIPRNIKDKGGFIANIGEAKLAGETLTVDLFAMPIKPLRLYLELDTEAERPNDLETIEVHEFGL